MSVLSDRDIRAALEAGHVLIRPYDPVDLQPSSVDLHLDRTFRVFRNNRYPYIDVRQPQPDLTELLRVEAMRSMRGAVGVGSSAVGAPGSCSVEIPLMPVSSSATRTTL